MQKEENSSGELGRIWHKFVAPHRKTLDMGNYIMHYIDIDQGEPVVMFHGNPRPRQASKNVDWVKEEWR